MPAAITIEDVLARLDGVQGGGQGQWTARCPHHPDRNNSLAVTIGANGKPLFNCFAGCDYRDIRHDLGLDVPGAFTPSPKSDHKADTGRAPNGDELRLLDEYLTAANRQLASDTPTAGEALAYVERRFGLSADEAVSIGLGVDGGSSVTSRPKFLANYGGKGAHLVVPMCDPAGRAVSCQARALADASEQRWLSPIGTVRGEDEKVNWTRFGFFAMGSPDPVMVCEGLSDPLTAVGAGYAAVGIRGATLARGHALVDELATALAGRRVVLAGDVDAAGKDFTKRLGEGLVAAGLEVRTLEIPVEHGDLTGWHEAVGHESFLSDLERAVSEAAEVLPPDGGPPGPPPAESEDEHTPRAEGPRHMTDLGNAKRLVDTFGPVLRFVPQWRTWIAWDGRRWKRDAMGQVHQYAKRVVRAMHLEAQVDDDKKLKAWATRSEAARALAAMVTVATTEPSMPIDPLELDADPWLLTVLNGTIDLRTGQLLEHDPTHLITKLAPVVYDPDATLEMWDRFLDTVTDGDAEMVGFLRRAAGYSLTGSTREEKLFFAYGPTASGKSTYLDALHATMGEYSMTADFNTFLEKRFSDGAKSDVARLAGARLVKSLEVDDGSKLAEGLVKTLTGGDKVTARFLYANEFEFQPAFKLWLAANHSPRIDYSDEAMWRRVLRVPFMHSLPPERRDPSVKATLRLPGVAGPAVLAWAVKGCLEWQEHGLGVPEAVVAATEAYRAEQDLLKDFFDDACVIAEALWVTKDDLYSAYEEWAKSSGMRRPFSKRRLGELMIERGFEEFRKRVAGRTTRLWKGIAVADTSVAASQLAIGDLGTLDDDTSRDTVGPRDTVVTQGNSTVSRAADPVTSDDEAESGDGDAVTQNRASFRTHARAGGEFPETPSTASLRRARSAPGPDDRCVECGTDEVWCLCVTCQVPLCRPHAGPHGEDHLREEEPELFDENGNFRGGPA